MCQHLQNQSTEEVLLIQAWDGRRNWVSYNPLEYTDLVRTKTVDSVFCALWLATQSVDIQRYSLIHLHFLQASEAKLAFVTSKIASPFAAVTKKEISQIIKQAVPEIHEVRFGSFNRYKALSFWLEFIDETGEKVFCLQMQIKPKSCVTLFSWLVHK